MEEEFSMKEQDIRSTFGAQLEEVCYNDHTFDTYSDGNVFSILNPSNSGL